MEERLQCASLAQERCAIRAEPLRRPTQHVEPPLVAARGVALRGGTGSTALDGREALPQRALELPDRLA
jgi:hypothetical protein